ncbi:MAG: hypothetical protein H6738_03365 [Alphaproteobacteria bacterium]|nr:hypothetical protein [Alphaproteobacteria bacterium]MCB9695806.1 hypothetical protein [Alphaproteobacteria bacterium]
MDGSGANTRSTRRRWWALGAVLSIAVASAIAGVGWAWSRATSPTCDEIPREDLTLREMGTLRRLIEVYKRDPSQPLTLSARQASFLLREEFELTAWFTTSEAGGLSGQLTIPREDGCWNLSFDGTVEVDDGVATVVPQEIEVGDLSLGWLVGGHAWRLGPARMPQPKAEELLGHLASVRVDGGQILVKVDDPSWIR